MIAGTSVICVARSGRCCKDAESLTDDFKLPFDGGAQQGIGGVVFETLPSRKVRQQKRRPRGKRTGRSQR
jgi:hypothetical protein